MVNVHVSVFVESSDTVHVTVVVPKANVPPDTTASPLPSVQDMSLAVKVSTLSVAEGVGDQVTEAVDTPTAVEMSATEAGHVMTGFSSSVG